MSANHQRQIAASLDQYSQLVQAGINVELAQVITLADNRSTTNRDRPASNLVALLRRHPELQSKIESLTDLERVAMTQAAARALAGVSGLPGAGVIPAATLAVMVGVLGLMVFFVFPELHNIFAAEGAELPLLTRVAIGLGTWVMLPLLILVALVFAAGPLGARLGGMWARWAAQTDQWLDKVTPVRRQRRTQATRVLAQWLAATTGLLSPKESTSCLAELLGPGWFKRHLERLAGDVGAGTALQTALAKGPWLPGLGIVMQEAGSAPAGLEAYGSSLALRDDDAVGRLLIFWKLALGAFVGFFVVAMYSAIFLLASGM